EEDAARRRQAEEDAARRRQAEEDAARRRQAEEDAARRRQAEEDAARRRQAEEEASRRRVDQEATKRPHSGRRPEQPTPQQIGDQQEGSSQEGGWRRLMPSWGRSKEPEVAAPNPLRASAPKGERLATLSAAPPPLQRGSISPAPSGDLVRRQSQLEGQLRKTLEGMIQQTKRVNSLESNLKGSEQLRQETFDQLDATIASQGDVLTQTKSQVQEAIRTQQEVSEQLAEAEQWRVEAERKLTEKADFDAAQISELIQASVQLAEQRWSAQLEEAQRSLIESEAARLESEATRLRSEEAAREELNALRTALEKRSKVEEETVSALSRLKALERAQRELQQTQKLQAELSLLTGGAARRKPSLWGLLQGGLSGLFGAKSGPEERAPQSMLRGDAERAAPLRSSKQGSSTLQIASRGPEAVPAERLDLEEREQSDPEERSGLFDRFTQQLKRWSGTEDDATTGEEGDLGAGLAFMDLEEGAEEGSGELPLDESDSEGGDQLEERPLEWRQPIEGSEYQVGGLTMSRLPAMDGAHQTLYPLLMQQAKILKRQEQQIQTQAEELARRKKENQAQRSNLEGLKSELDGALKSTQRELQKLRQQKDGSRENRGRLKQHQRRLGQLELKIEGFEAKLAAFDEKLSARDPSRQAADIRVSPKPGEGDYNSIAEAIEAAPVGAFIGLMPGVYEEALELNKPVRLLGLGKPNEVILQARGETAFSVNRAGGLYQEALSAEAEREIRKKMERLQEHHAGAQESGGLFKWVRRQISGEPIEEESFFEQETGRDEVSVVGITIMSITEEVGGASTGKPTILVRAGHLRLENCEVRAENGAAISVEGEHAELTVRGSRIIKAKTSGVILRTRAKLTLAKSVIDQCKESGVDGQGYTSIRLMDSEVTNNQRTGIQVGFKSELLAYDTIISGNSFEGVWVSNQSNGSIRNCDMRGNARGPLDISADSDIALSGNKP
ncbi:MAG: right-handed parallel beta-helix repeat-containing protein, partial [Myxococcota bacterium]|nr:right-handed parallel beta-helix repeat-containing protein [Myxococcota bacterium]